MWYDKNNFRFDEKSYCTMSPLHVNGLALRIPLRNIDNASSLKLLWQFSTFKKKLVTHHIYIVVLGKSETYPWYIGKVVVSQVNCNTNTITMLL
jgi:hypothetical protein